MEVSITDQLQVKKFTKILSILGSVSFISGTSYWCANHGEKIRAIIGADSSRIKRVESDMDITLFNRSEHEFICNSDNWSAWDGNASLGFELDLANDILCHINIGWVSATRRYAYSLGARWEADVVLPAEYILNIKSILEYEIMQFIHGKYEAHLQKQKDDWVQDYYNKIIVTAI